MQLICALVGHQPPPFRPFRAGGHDPLCLVCQRPLTLSADGGWSPADEGSKAGLPPE